MYNFYIYPVKYLGLIFLFFLGSFVISNEAVYFGIVERQMGVGIFVCAIPARDFDTVCVLHTKKDFNSYPGPSIPQYVEGIQKAMDNLADKAVRKAKKNKKINAIISRDGKSAVAVHFKTEVSPAMANMAKVDSYKGYALFIQNKPQKKYTVLSKVKLNNQIRLDDVGSYTLNTMLDSLIVKYERKNDLQKANALITTSCVEAEFVKIID